MAELAGTRDASYERIAISEAAPGVQVVTLNRPEKRNAIDNPMRTELLSALQRADGDANVRVSMCAARARASRRATT